MLKLMQLLLISVFFSSTYAYSKDSTSLSAEDNVTAQKNGGTGSLMTGGELFEAAKGKTIGDYQVGVDGYLRGLNTKKQFVPLCVISSATCSYGNVYTGLRTFNLTPGGFQVINSTVAGPYSTASTTVQTIPWK